MHIEYTVIIDMVQLLKKYIIDTNLTCVCVYVVEMYGRNVNTHAVIINVIRTSGDTYEFSIVDSIYTKSLERCFGVSSQKYISTLYLRLTQRRTRFRS